METTINSKELREKGEIILQDENNTLRLFFSEHLGKFITEFNNKFFASSKSVSSPLKKFNQMALKHGLTN